MLSFLFGLAMPSEPTFSKLLLFFKGFVTISLVASGLLFSGCDKKSSSRQRTARVVGQKTFDEAGRRGGDQAGVAGAASQPRFGSKTLGPQNTESQGPGPQDPSQHGAIGVGADPRGVGPQMPQPQTEASAGRAGVLIPNNNGGSHSRLNRGGPRSSDTPQASNRQLSPGWPQIGDNPRSKNDGYDELGSSLRGQSQDGESAKPMDEALFTGLQLLLSELSRHYLEAIFVVTKEERYRPRTFFEGLAIKLKNAYSRGELITVRAKQASAQHLERLCQQGERIIHLVDSDKGHHFLKQFNESTGRCDNLFFFTKSDNQWKVGTTVDGLSRIMAGQLGTIPTLPRSKEDCSTFQMSQCVVVKPRCEVTVDSEFDSLSIKKLRCMGWGQQLANESYKQKKTILFNYFEYNSVSEEVFRAEAQYIDFDENNQICLSGKLIRKAPRSTNLIHVLDEGVMEEGRSRCSIDHQSLRGDELHSKMESEKKASPEVQVKEVVRHEGHDTRVDEAQAGEKQESDEVSSGRQGESETQATEGESQSLETDQQSPGSIFPPSADELGGKEELETEGSLETP